MSSLALKRILIRSYPLFPGVSAARSNHFHRQVRWREACCRVQILHERNVFTNFSDHLPDLSVAYRPKCCAGLLLVRGMAGHSKWQNIRHIKAAKDAERAAINERFSRMIRGVMRGGGSPDPNLNPKLAQVVEQARKKFVPSATIENAIKASAKSKEALEPATVELKGPGGCILIVELLTDNLARSKQNIRAILNKTRSSMLDGSAKHFFEHKGVINIQAGENLSFEKATEDAIEAGAEDIREAEDEDGIAVFQFLSDPMDFFKVKKNLEAMNYSIYSSGVKFLPFVKHKMKDEDISITEKLFERLENVPEVVNIYDNIE